MSSLDIAIKRHISYIVKEEYRPFCYRDLLYFKVDGIEHEMTHGVFRNKISRLVKEGFIEICINSKPVFYILKDFRFGKSVITNPTGVMKCHHNQQQQIKIIQRLPFGKESLHDIHYCFKVAGCWDLLAGATTAAGSKRYKINPVSKFISLPPVFHGSLKLLTTVYRTDTITVVVGCSHAPIVYDLAGMIHLVKALVRVEERLQGRLDDCSGSTAPLLRVPDSGRWTVMQWHFGRDSPVPYTGEKFNVEWRNAQNELFHAYSKEFPATVTGRGKSKGKSKNKSKTRIRVEQPQYPQMPFEEVIRDVMDQQQQWRGGGRLLQQQQQYHYYTNSVFQCKAKQEEARN